MNFTTASQVVSNREPKHMILGKTRKPGRPPRSEIDRIRTIAWFKAVEIALEVSGPKAVGRCIQAASDSLAPKGWSGDLKGANRWARYAVGRQKPVDGLVDFINEIIPDSAHIFYRGPNDLWLVLWEDNEFQIGYDDIETICNVFAVEIDFHWLARAIAAWRRSVQNEGLYEAIMLGLNSPNIKLTLSGLGVWESICTDIRSTERRHLLSDMKKVEEIFMLGRHFLMTNDPIESYLQNPVKFSLDVIESKEIKASITYAKLAAVVSQHCEQ